MNDPQSNDEPQNYLLALFKEHELDDLRANFLENEDFTKRYNKTSITKTIFNSSQINGHNQNKLERKKLQSYSSILVDFKAQNVDEEETFSVLIESNFPHVEQDHPRNSIIQKWHWK